MSLSSYAAEGTASTSGATTGGLGNFGMLPFQFSISSRSGYDDNISTSSLNPDQSWFTNVGAATTYSFGSQRTKLNLGVGGGVTYYYSNSATTDNLDKNGYLSFSATHKASSRLTLNTVAYAAYQQEPDFSLGLGVNRRSGSYFYSNDKFMATYLWAPRFSTATSYNLGVVHYDSAAIGLFEDRTEHTIGNEFQFLVWPTTVAVAEYRFGIVSYDNIDRDSTSHFALAGFNHNFSPRFDISLRGGAEFRDYDLTGAQSSPYFESTVNYALGKDSTVSWTNRYAIEEADVLLNPSRTTFRTGLRAKHNFTARISGVLNAYYENDAYDAINSPLAVSPGFNEDSFDVELTARYTLNRFFAVEGGYTHTEVFSDDVFREYSRNRFFAGLNLTF